jgi:hypothetical protein
VEVDMQEFKGRIVFWGVPLDPAGGAVPRFGLAVVEENEPGYHPYRDVTFESKELADDAAEGLNQKLGLSREEAAIIVASSMRVQNQGRRAKRSGR